MICQFRKHVAFYRSHETTGAAGCCGKKKRAEPPALLTNTQTKSNPTCIVQDVFETWHASSFYCDEVCDAILAEPSCPAYHLSSHEHGADTFFHEVLRVDEFFVNDPERRVLSLANDPGRQALYVNDPGRPYSSQQVATPQRLQTQKMR